MGGKQRYRSEPENMIVAVELLKALNGVQRAVKENCNVLKFKKAEFEGGE